MVHIYLDMNIYNRPFDNQNQIRIRLETVAIESLFALIESGKFSVYWSFVSEYENSMNPSSTRRTYVHQLSRICSHSIKPNDSVRQRGERIAEKCGIQGRDALHIACAESVECEYMVTCDDRLIKQAERCNEKGLLKIRVINPIDLLREV